MADRGINSKEELDRILRPQLAGEHGHYTGRRGYMRKDLIQIMGRLVYEEDNVFPGQNPVVAPPANLQAPTAALTADEEDLAALLAVGSAVGLLRQIEREREALNTMIVPATVDAGLVPTVGLVDNNDGSGPRLTPTLEVHVARQTK